MGLALDLVSMVEFALGLHIHYDLVHYFFYLIYGLGDGAT